MIQPPIDGQETIPHGGKILLLATIGEQLEKKRGTAACAVPPSGCASYGLSRLEIVVVQ
jgi:hypothetical protein